MELKALHVIPAVAPRYGGPSLAVVEMCRSLRDLGLEVLIATTDADGPGRMSVPLGAPTDFEGVPTIFFPRQWSESFKYSPALSRWLAVHAAAFDLLHVHAVFSHSSLAAAGACRRHRIPYVVRPLGSLDPWSLRQKPLRKRLLWHSGAKRMIRGAASIHYTTAAERTLAEKSAGGSPGVVIPLGIEEGIFRSPAASEDRFSGREDSPYALVLCRLHPKKGLELLLETFLEVTAAEDLRHWRLIIAGDGEGEYVDRLHGLLRDRMGRDRVVFTGWLSGERKLSMLRGAALAVLTSYQENFGLSMVEALACGVPVLVSDRVNLAEEIESERVGWVSSLDRSSLTRSLGEALRADRERWRRGAAGRSLASRRFQWPVVGAELIELYRSLVSRR